jgi:hypothetical protein
MLDQSAAGLHQPLLQARDSPLAALGPDGGAENRVRTPGKDFSELSLGSMALYFLDLDLEAQESRRPRVLKILESGMDNAGF